MIGRGTLVFMLATIVTFSTLHEARADKYYAFIKMHCDRESQAVTISSIAPPGNDPEATVDDIRSGKIKNLYYLNDISKAHQKISCQLGQGEIVSFEGVQSQDHPERDDAILVSLSRCADSNI